MTLDINRRKFVQSAATVASISALSISSGGIFHFFSESQSEISKISRVLDEYLPNISIDKADKQRFAKEVVGKLQGVSGKNGQAFAGIFNSAPNRRQLEHFIVQEFLVSRSFLAVG